MTRFVLACVLSIGILKGQARVGTPGTWNQVSTDAYGRVIHGANVVPIAPTDDVLMHQLIATADESFFGNAAIRLSTGNRGSTSSVWLDATGTTTDINMTFRTKGTGSFFFNTGRVQVAAGLVVAAPCTNTNCVGGVVTAPALSSTPCDQNTTAFDNAYFYVCTVSANNWRRVALLPMSVSGDYTDASQLVSGTLAAARMQSIGTPGTYSSVTTDTQGRVTAGTNPTAILNNDAQIAYASGNLTLVTATYNDMPGVTLTLARAGTYLISGHFSFVGIGAGDTVQFGLGRMVANGTVQAGAVVFGVLVNVAQSEIGIATQQWLYTAASAGLVVKLQATKSGGTGTSNTDLNSSISAIWIAP